MKPKPTRYDITDVGATPKEKREWRRKREQSAKQTKTDSSNTHPRSLMDLSRLSKQELCFLVKYLDEEFASFDLGDDERSLLTELTSSEGVYLKGSFIETITNQWGDEAYRVINVALKDVLYFLLEQLPNW